MRPALVVSIDTEEEGLWTDHYRATGNSCRNVAALPRLHAMLARLGVRPTYLVDHPVAVDREAVAVLRELASDGSEIGAHLHPWCTPPLYPGGEAARWSFPHQLPPDRLRAKLRVLLAEIRKSFGVTASSYRAGRWGFDHTSVPVLEELGIRVDSSVHALWWEREPGGPNHARAPHAPYRLARTDACRPGVSELYEVPACHVMVGRAGALLESIFRRAPAAPGMRMLMRGLGLRALNPEEHPLADLRAVADTIAARGLPVFNVFFHSSALLPGATPYVRDAAALERFLARVQGLVEHILGRHHAVSLGLSSVPAHLEGHGRSACASAS